MKTLQMKSAKAQLASCKPNTECIDISLDKTHNSTNFKDIPKKTGSKCLGLSSQQDKNKSCCGNTT